MERAWNEEGEEAVYRYNGMGQRVEKRSGSKQEEYILNFTKPCHNLLGVQREEERESFYRDYTTIATEKKGNSPVIICRMNWEVPCGYSMLREEESAMDGLSSYYEYNLEVREEVFGVKTNNISLSGRASMGGSISGSIGVTNDYSGNIAFQMTIAGGGGIPGIGIGFSNMLTDAPSYENLEGWGGVTGGSFSPGIDLGYDLIFMDSYVGHSASVGVGVNLPWTLFCEMHGEASYTVTLLHFNVYDVLEFLKFDDVSDCN